MWWNKKSCGATSSQSSKISYFNNDSEESTKIRIKLCHKYSSHFCFMYFVHHPIGRITSRPSSVVFYEMGENIGEGCYLWLKYISIWKKRCTSGRLSATSQKRWRLTMTIMSCNLKWKHFSAEIACGKLHLLLENLYFLLFCTGSLFKVVT